MNTDIFIAKADINDLNKIDSLMEYAKKENAKNGFFCADDISYIQEHIINSEKGFVLKAQFESQIAGFFILHIPHQDPNNMGIYKNLSPTECEQVVHFDSTVVHPDFRGHKLMNSFMNKTEELLLTMPYRHCFATVHPDNLYSYHNLLKHNFEVITTTLKYGGLKRHIMYKEIIHQ